MTTIKPRTITAVLFQGDDFDPLDALMADAQRAVTQAASNSPTRIGDDNGVQAATTAYNDYLDKAVKRGVKVELHAVGRKVWRDLVAKHPPRETTTVGPSVTAPDGTVTEGEKTVTVHEADEQWGFNYETLADDLVPACVDSAKFDEAFLDGLSDGDWSKLYSAAVRRNTEEGPSPKARISWPAAPTSGEISGSPARLG